MPSRSGTYGERPGPTQSETRHCGETNKGLPGRRTFCQRRVGADPSGPSSHISRRLTRKASAQRSVIDLDLEGESPVDEYHAD